MFYLTITFYHIKVDGKIIILCYKLNYVFDIGWETNK